MPRAGSPRCPTAPTGWTACSIVGIDLRDPAQVVALADSVAAQGPLDILINNAAQTVRRSPGAYSHLADAELEPLPDRPLPQITTFGRTTAAPTRPRSPGRSPS